MKDAKVSIIIPIWNAEKHLRETMDSALDQDYENIEVIAVDDGSSDHSLDILAGIGDSRLKIIRQENRGQSAASNTGWRYASGEYIKYLDQDDILNKTHISSQVNAIKDEGGMIASCRWTYFQGDWRKTKCPNALTDRDYRYPLFWIGDSLERDRGMMGVWQWLVPRRIFEKSGGWDDRISLENDFDLSVRILMTAKGIRFAREAELYYRKGNENSLSAVRSEKAIQSALLATDKGTDQIRHHQDSHWTRRLCANRYQDWAYQAYPMYPALVLSAEKKIQTLGGSSFPLQGGMILNILISFLGWKQVRHLQHWAYRMGWLKIRRLFSNKP